MPAFNPSGRVKVGSSYPEGKVTVAFRPSQTTEQSIITFITDLGFTVKN